MGRKKKAQPALKAGATYVLVSAVRRDEQGRFEHEVPFHKEGSSEQWRQRLRYTVEVWSSGGEWRLLDH